ncbi:MAG: GIY-YIG nuclease family protein [Ruminococcaceae bacterium]|nr:GIY-YIG nuclease family protein [Oscillospiraceae bacterium]
MEKFFVYLLRCNDGTLYTGYTTDLDARIRVHNGEGKGGAKYTRSRRPVTLAYFEEYEDKSTALRRECEIKKLSKAEKEALIGDK